MTAQQSWQLWRCCASQRNCSLLRFISSHLPSSLLLSSRLLFSRLEEPAGAWLVCVAACGVTGYEPTCLIQFVPNIVQRLFVSDDDSMTAAYVHFFPTRSSLTGSVLLLFNSFGSFLLFKRSPLPALHLYAVLLHTPRAILPLPLAAPKVPRPAQSKKVTLSWWVITL